MRLAPTLTLLASLAGCHGGSAPFDTRWNELPDGGFARDAGRRPPPEEEVEVRFDPPAVGETVLYATSAESGRVAVIHADDFSIETVPVGAGPLPAVAAPGRDLAVSLDRGASSVTVLRTPAGGPTSTRTLPLAHEANTVAFSPDAAYAVLFEGPRPGTTRTNFHDLSVLDLTEGGERVVRAVVGYGPSRVTFDAAGSRAIVVTEDGISQIELGALPEDGVLRAPLLQLGTIDPISLTEVAPGGDYALALAGLAELVQLDLRDGSVTTVDLSVLTGGGELDATDLDIAPSGEEALVVLRSHELLVRVPIGELFADPSAWTVLDLAGHAIGSVALSPGGAKVVAYTTRPDVETITVLDLVENRGRHVSLRKSVRAVAVSADGRFALVLHHARTDVTELDEEAAVDRAHGYSLVDLETGFARLMLVDAEPRSDAFVLEPSGERLFLGLRDDARSIRELQVVDLATFAVDRVPLVAPPTTVGVFPALDRAFIGQEADGGRVTFYLWETGETHTVAGFELAARIRR